MENPQQLNPYPQQNPASNPPPYQGSQQYPGAYPEYYSPGAQRDNSGKATTGLVLGIISLVAWILPIIGLPVTICGIVYSSKGLSSSARGRAAAGLTLSIIGAFLTVINAAIGAYMGAHGQLWYQKH